MNEGRFLPSFPRQWASRNLTLPISSECIKFNPVDVHKLNASDEQLQT